MIEARERQGILAAFRAAAQQGTNIPTKLTRGAGCAMKALALFAEYPPALGNGRQGEERAARLIMALKREGLLVERDYRNAQRQAKQRFELAGCAVTPTEDTETEAGGA